MTEASSSGKSVYLYQNTWCYIAGESTLHNHIKIQFLVAKLKMDSSI